VPIPQNRNRYSLPHTERRPPSEYLFYLRAVQLQKIRLMGAAGAWIDPRYAPAPGRAEQIRQLACCYAVLIVGPHIIISSEGRILILGHGDKKIYKQRLQNVLIGSGGIRIPDHNSLSLHRRPDTVG